MKQITITIAITLPDECETPCQPRVEQEVKADTPVDVKTFLTEAGRVGGSSTSEAKRISSARNAAKAREAKLARIQAAQ